MSIDFKSKVYQEITDAEYIGRSLLLEKVAKRDEIENIGPRAFVTAMTNALEYFGLLLPHAKIIAPQNVTSGHVFYQPHSRITSPQSWAVWTQDEKKWMIEVNVRVQGSKPQYKTEVAGKIAFPTDVDYWKAFRGLYPNRYNRFKSESKLDFAEYEQNPFDMPLCWVRHGNEELDGEGIEPIYHISDVDKCLNLSGFFKRTLPIEYCIMAFEESQKRIQKGKTNASLKIQETLWQSVINGFDCDLRDTRKCFPSTPKIKIEKHFYRNRFITSFIESLNNDGMAIVRACGEVAKKIAFNNASGDEPLDAESIRTNIYYPTKKKHPFSQ